MTVELYIINNGISQLPIVVSGIQLTLERKGTPGKLTFSVVKDDVLDFTEGNEVDLIVDGAYMFRGYVFIKKRNKDGTIAVTAYDQLRYLKNKDTIVQYNKTASQLIKLIAEDFNLQVGELEDTGLVIAEITESDTTLFDMIQSTLDKTLVQTGHMYVLYDDYGKLTLKNIESMKTNMLLTDSTAEDFDYTSSIDDETYNKIKLTYDNEESGMRDVYIAQDGEHINEWGVLQYYEKLDNIENPAARADGLLNLYNAKTRTLTVSNVLGDTSIRAGSAIGVQLNLGDLVLQNYMVVEKVKHNFENCHHLMDLALRRDGFTV